MPRCRPPTSLGSRRGECSCIRRAPLVRDRAMRGPLAAPSLPTARGWSRPARRRHAGSAPRPVDVSAGICGLGYFRIPPERLVAGTGRSGDRYAVRRRSGCWCCPTGSRAVSRSRDGHSHDGPLRRDTAPRRTERLCGRCDLAFRVTNESGPTPARGLAGGVSATTRRASLGRDALCGSLLLAVDDEVAGQRRSAEFREPTGSRDPAEVHQGSEAVFTVLCRNL